MNERWRIAGLALLAVVASAGMALFAASIQRAPEGPRDGRGWVLEAREKMEANKFAEASLAYEKGIAASRKVAADPGVWCELADALGMAQGGKLMGRPIELIQRALTLNPGHPRALEMAGSAAYEDGDYALALRHWEQLLAQLKPGSGAYADLSSAIARTRAML